MPADLRPRPQAVGLVRTALSGHDRVLVTGATGWFGRTALALLVGALGREGLERQVLAVGSRPAMVDVLGVGDLVVAPYDVDAVAHFRPTVVINCAFPTRDRVLSVGFDRYVEKSLGLTEKLLAVAAVPSVARLVTFSSGAALPSPSFPADLRCNPYGVLKAREERATLLAGKMHGIGVHVMRVWSVSGIHVQRPEAYAFSQLVLGAVRGGPITVRADHPVLRRYALVDDVIALALASAGPGPVAADTGGPLVELGELASAIAARVGHVAVVRAGFRPDLPTERYAAEGSAFEDLAASHGLQLAGLDEQIGRVAAAARSWQ